MIPRILVKMSEWVSAFFLLRFLYAGYLKQTVVLGMQLDTIQQHLFYSALSAITSLLRRVSFGIPGC